MRAVIQRVRNAHVEINHKKTASIQQGLLIFLGIEEEDEKEDAIWLTNKISQLRIFSDKEGKMNHSIKDIQGEILIVSQFTLHAKTKKGNRPSFIQAAQPQKAIPLYEFTVTAFQQTNLVVKTGEFGADMKISLINDGPVTIIIDTKNRE
jgi:D-tyrosyl-tRNA(Tyr) deacylase